VSLPGGVRPPQDAPQGGMSPQDGPGSDLQPQGGPQPPAPPQPPQDSAQPLYLTSEDRKDAKKALNKAKHENKKAKRAAAQAAEKAAEEAKREARLKRKEALKITVVDGNVIDNEGRVIRPYSRAERFFDSKKLVYAVLIAFIAICLALTVLMMSLS
jgi:hypothetical protein